MCAYAATCAVHVQSDGLPPGPRPCEGSEGSGLRDEAKGAAVMGSGSMVIAVPVGPRIPSGFV